MALAEAAGRQVLAATVPFGALKGSGSVREMDSPFFESYLQTKSVVTGV